MICLQIISPGLSHFLQYTTGRGSSGFDRFPISKTSWWMAGNELGAGISYIEVEREFISVERACNDAIRNNVGFKSDK